MGTNALTLGRAAFDGRRWTESFQQLTAADQITPLEPEDLERLATITFLLGMNDASADAWTRAQHILQERGESTRAARCIFWLCYSYFQRGDMAQGGGWLARGQRLLEEIGEDCAERGYLMMPVGIGAAQGGDQEAALTIFSEIVEIAERFKDRQLATFGRMGMGRSLIRMGRGTEGAPCLDEVMIAVTAGEVPPIIAGDVYCTVIEGCVEMFDMRRAQEWTTALNTFCESQPDLIPFRGQCFIHRSQLALLHSAWPEAIEEAQRARERFELMQGQTAMGEAFYQQAEVHRLRGDWGEADENYRLANQWGRKPEPGLALVRLLQGNVDAADANIRRALDEAHGVYDRTPLLPAFVDIMLAAGDLDAARVASTELSSIAEGLGTTLVFARAAHAEGATLLMQGDARAALEHLRRAWVKWRELDAPYEAARTAVLISQACRRLGDEDGAAVEADGARVAFEKLGARPDLNHMEDVAAKASRGADGGLTGRELEILRLVAAGKTNRGIADELVISEKTVARHVSNIFTKLSLSSRSAATAYAYKHDLV